MTPPPADPPQHDPHAPGPDPERAGAAPTVVMHCPLPPHLAYDVPNHIWYDVRPDGRVRIGMTAIAVALASGRVFAFTPKRVGREIEAGRSCATIESSKWVGPARVAFDGVVVAVNQDLIDRPSLLASDPYGAGWMIEAQPSRPDALAPLTSGREVADVYAAWMRDNDFPGCPPPP